MSIVSLFCVVFSTGIPCFHAISAIWAATKDPMDFIDGCYSVETYMACYNPCIFPINGEREWTKTNLTPPVPPAYGRAPGRPKKNRRKNDIEVRETKEKKRTVSRVGQTCKCSYCGEKGHNKRTCKLRDEAEVEDGTQVRQSQEDNTQDQQNNTKVRNSKFIFTYTLYCLGLITMRFHD